MAPFETTSVASTFTQRAFIRSTEKNLLNIEVFQEALVGFMTHTHS